jgi:electron transfer flavoprotein alpha/beta subunit
LDESEIGLNGSFTQVVKVFSPPIKKSGKIIDGSNPQNAANKLFTFLKEKKIV